MRKRRVLVAFGTRPEGIKMMPVIRALRRRPCIDLTVVATGQHREMLSQVFRTFGEVPDLDLELMTADQSLADVTAAVLTGMSRMLAEHKPDLVLVHGDTTTAMATALAAFYSRVAIGHVEAGLRSNDLSQPWPEEFNRVAVDTLATLMFAPTSAARENLLSEYNRHGSVYITGNTGIDSLLFVDALLKPDSDLLAEVASRYYYLDPARRLILVTGHRRESFGQGFRRICDGLRNLSERSDIQIFYPVHLNPNVRMIMLECLRGKENIILAEPVEYLDMVYLMRRAAVIVTDSGGIQEEGPALGRPVLVMRHVTERPEAIGTGVVRLIGTDPEVIRSEVDLLLDDRSAYLERARPVFPFGDGTAGEQIATIIEDEFFA